MQFCNEQIRTQPLFSPPCASATYGSARMCRRKNSTFGRLFWSPTGSRQAIRIARICETRLFFAKLTFTYWSWNKIKDNLDSETTLLNVLFIHQTSCALIPPFNLYNLILFSQTPFTQQSVTVIWQKIHSNLAENSLNTWKQLDISQHLINHLDSILKSAWIINGVKNFEKIISMAQCKPAVTPVC